MRERLCWWHLMIGIVGTLVVLALLFVSLGHGQGTVEPLRIVRVNDPRGVLDPKVRAVLDDLARQINEGNNAIYERLRKLADSICCP